MNTQFLNNTIDTRVGNDTMNSALFALVIIAIVLLVLLVIASLYLISSLRRRNVVLKKVDYLIEDVTYKSESLNVTVETLNKLSNYLLSLDAVTQKGFSSALKLIGENKNYIYAIMERLRDDVESKEKKPKAKKTTSTKTAEKKTTTTKTNTKKTTSKKK